MAKGATKKKDLTYVLPYNSQWQAVLIYELISRLKVVVEQTGPGGLDMAFFMFHSWDDKSKAKVLRQAIKSFASFAKLSPYVEPDFGRD